MLLRRFTDFLLQGRLIAIAAVFLIAFIPLIGSISIVIAALVTLRKGPFEGALVLIATILPIVISASYHQQALLDNNQIAMFVLGVVIFSNMLTWFFSVILRKFGSWSVTLEIAVLLGVLVVGLVHLFYPDIQSWWATNLTAYFTKMAKVAGKLTTEMSVKKIEAISVIKQYMTGLIVTMVLCNTFLQLLVARWWQAVMFNPGGLQKELYQVRLNYMVAIVFIIGLILAYFNNEFAIDEISVLYTTFFLAGMCLLHRLVSVAKNRRIWLLLIYMAVIVFFPLSIVAVAMIALCDSGLDFRKRFL